MSEYHANTMQFSTWYPCKLRDTYAQTYENILKSLISEFQSYYSLQNSLKSSHLNDSQTQVQNKWEKINKGSVYRKCQNKKIKDLQNIKRTKWSSKSHCARNMYWTECDCIVELTGTYIHVLR